MKTVKRSKLLPLLCAALSPIFWLAALCPATALANVGLFDGSGASITLGNTDQIQMVSEVVEISFSPAQGPVTGDLVHRDKAHYNCRFVLKNLSNQTVTAQVGFPLLAQRDMPDPQEYPAAQAMLLEHYGFTAQSGDTVYPVRYQMRDAENEYRYVFIWDMEFAPGQTVELSVRYSVYGYNGLGSTEKQPPYFDAAYAKNYLSDLQQTVIQAYPYVTQTAGSWAGEVERAEFIIHDADFEAHLRKRGGLERDETQQISAANKSQAERFDSELQNGTFYRYISAGNWQPAADGKSLTWKEAPFTEHKDIEIRYMFTILPKNAEGFTNLLKGIEENYEQFGSRLLSMMEKVKEGDAPDKQERIARMGSYLNKHYPAPFADADRKNVADAVLEFYGIPTNNPEITDFLERQSWYPITVPRAIDAELKAELLRWHSISRTQDTGVGNPPAAQ